MSEDLPQLAPGYVRLAVLLKDPERITNGDLVRATGVGPDRLGPVLILGHQASVDVERDQADLAREGLSKLGPTQIVAIEQVTHRYVWLRFQAGRNHGLTMGQLRKLLIKADAGPIGRIHINNTHSLIGVRDDHLERTLQHFAEARVNGVAIKPQQLAPGTIREAPDYKRRRGD